METARTAPVPPLATRVAITVSTGTEESKAAPATEAAAARKPVDAKTLVPSVTLWLHIVRHAKNTHRTKSDTPDDPELSELGRKQAECLKHNLHIDINRPEYTHASDKTTSVGGGIATTDTTHCLVPPAEVLTSTYYRAQETALLAGYLPPGTRIDRGAEPPFAHHQLDELVASNRYNFMLGTDTVSWLWLRALATADRARETVAASPTTPVTVRFVLFTHAIRTKYILQAATACPALHLGTSNASYTCLTLHSNDVAGHPRHLSPHVTLFAANAGQACIPRPGHTKVETEPAFKWNEADARNV